MIQKGEPVTYLSMVILVVVLGGVVFLGTQIPGTSVTGAGITEMSGGICGDGNLCYLSVAVVFAAIFIASLEIARRLK